MFEVFLIRYTCNCNVNESLLHHKTDRVPSLLRVVEFHWIRTGDELDEVSKTPFLNKLTKYKHNPNDIESETKIFLEC